MIRNYVTIALRNLTRHKLYSLINLLGLASGMACFILITLYVRNEMTFDSFHGNASDIYLINQIEKSPDGDHLAAATPDPLAGVLKNDFPGLAGVVRFFGNEFPVTANGKTFKEKLLCTTPSVFSMFTFPLAEGDPSTALAGVNSAVVTQEVAERYFGNADPMGKTLSLSGRFDFVITGVLKKIPENSSIRFGMLVPEAMLKQVMPDFGTKWYSSGSYTFVQCSGNMTPEELNAQLPLLIRKYVPAWLQGRMGLGMQRLTSIHLTAGMDFEDATGMSRSSLILLLLIATAILLVACFNYVNLATARHSERAKEIGMRKVMGASRPQLASQFISESIVLTFLALLLGLVFAELFLPEFNALTGRTLDFAFGRNPAVLPVLIAFGLIVGVFAGSYPAIFLTSRRVIESLKGERVVRGAKIGTRSSLVLMQFVVSTALIIVVLVVTAQLQFMRHHDLGFDPSAMLVIPTHASEAQDALPKIHAYLNSIDTRAAAAGIISRAVSEHVPGYYFNNRFGVVPAGWGDKHPLEMIVTSVDESFLDCYRMQLAEGRNFSRGRLADEYQSVLINESAARRMGLASPIGAQFTYVHGEGPFTVIGVVKDIHFRSLLTPIEPQIYRPVVGAYQMGFISVRITPGTAARTIATLREEWGNVMKDAPFEYFFVADKYAASYPDEERVQEIVGFASLLAVMLASLGLVGLVSLSVNQRTKEIGIRKALGATIGNILLLLSRRFVALVLAANLAAWPLAYFAMQRWLEGYPYRTAMGPGLFLAGAALAFVLALLAVGSQAIRAAVSNPVDSLRYE